MIQPNQTEAAGTLVVNHLARQERALRVFLAGHPADAHVFEAELRLARLLQIRAEFEGSDKPRVEAARILDGLEKTATPEQRPELEFSRVTRMMRALHRSDPSQCEELLRAAQRFQSLYPDDRRVASLLTEVATLFDNQPKTKETLLEDALVVAKEPDLKARINDDLKRVRTARSGGAIELYVHGGAGNQRREPARAGQFLSSSSAAFSPPSTAALGKLQQAVAELPPGSVRVVGVSLDDKRETALATLKAHGVAWPVAYDGKGWESPLVRSLGINTLPTVWLLDAHGRLRSLNALESAAGQARQLLRER